MILDNRINLHRFKWRNCQQFKLYEIMGDFINTFYHFRMFTQITIAFRIRGNHYLITDYLLVLDRASVLKVFFNLIIVFCDSEYSKFLNSFLTFSLNYNNNRAKENTVL